MVGTSVIVKTSCLTLLFLFNPMLTLATDSIGSNSTSLSLDQDASLPTSTPTEGTGRIKTFKPRRKQLAKAAIVCKTPEFDLTVENWRDAKASQFLKDFALKNMGTEEYKTRGLIGSLTRQYLGRPELRCSLGQSHACLVTCHDVVSVIPDLEDARAFFFVLTAARHYLEVMETADKALLAAQVNVGQWNDVMSLKFYWTSETPQDRVFKSAIGLMSSFVTYMLSTFLPQVPFHHAERLLQAKLEEHAANKAQNKVMGIEAESIDEELAKQKNELDTKITHAKTIGNWMNSAYNTLHNGIPPLGIKALDFFTWESPEKPQVNNVAELGLAVSQFMGETRRRNSQSIFNTFNGALVEVDGSTMLQKILESGAFLSVDSQTLYQWTGPEVEKRLTDALKYRILSEALKSQGVYVHCTKSMNAATCEGDTRGPQNLKACVDGRVCYMNKWASRGFYWRHHVEEPFGINQLADWPIQVKPEDMIVSSYKSYLLSKGAPGNVFASTMFMNEHEMISPQSFLDASTPGAFFLPVCVNDRFHQNTPLADYTLFDDFNPNSEKKTLPCSCGPKGWGEETEKFWVDSGLATASHADRYKRSFCPKQLATKLGEDNKLELFVNECRLGVSRKGGLGALLGTHKNERHPLCDVVLDIIDKHGAEPDDVDPHIKIALECKLSLHVSGLFKKPKKDCKAYDSMSFDALAKFAASIRSH